MLLPLPNCSLLPIGWLILAVWFFAWVFELIQRRLQPLDRGLGSPISCDSLVGRQLNLAGVFADMFLGLLLSVNLNQEGGFCCSLVGLLWADSGFRGKPAKNLKSSTFSFAATLLRPIAEFFLPPNFFLLGAVRIAPQWFSRLVVRWYCLAYHLFCLIFFASWGMSWCLSVDGEPKMKGFFFFELRKIFGFLVGFFHGVATFRILLFDLPACGFIISGTSCWLCLICSQIFISPGIFRSVLSDLGIRI